MKTKSLEIPRVSDWYEVNVIVFNWTNGWDNFDLEVSYYEADGEYSSKYTKQVFKGAYCKVEILDNNTGKTKTKECVGESANHEIRRWAEDYVHDLLFRKVK
jgi:hypothetical protein